MKLSPTGNSRQTEKRDALVATATLPRQLASRFADATGDAFAAAIDPQSLNNVTEYVVAWGDTLSRIASIHGLSIETLMATNNLQNPDLLRVGQIIKLPPPPDANGPSFHILPDSRLVRSYGAHSFDIQAFVNAQPGILRKMGGSAVSRHADGSTANIALTASETVQRVSLDFSVDPRVLLAFLEYRAGLLSNLDVGGEQLLYPLFSPQASGGIDRPGLYAQLTWLADQLNYGYYGKKYRGDAIVDFADGSRLLYHHDLNPGTAAIQHVLARMTSGASWTRDVGDGGFYLVYRSLFGDPFADYEEDDTSALMQPKLSLPFRPGEVWRFTGGYHGGWGNGSAWASVDFAPPAESGPVHYCYTSTFPVTAVVRGKIARLSEGAVILDLDLDGNEGSGWTILYLHTSHAESLEQGQIVEAGDVLGYPSCEGGYSTATHLHIARRYNGEWIPADCVNCPSSLTVPPFTMSDWQVVGLRNQAYQGFLLNTTDNRSVIAEQGRATSVNQISW
ncbi:MAG: LysM peptidoglycan-binding domain-containing protein [Chloroflexi bacterium]|nr:LysM peptidoglycan-binding domain-containing protein [Chloroflexota bacterium]